VGAYHDSFSGAFVNYDVGAPTVIAPPLAESGDDVDTGQLEGVEYRIMRRDVKCEDSRERSPNLYVTFFMKHLPFSVWNFWTTVCGSRQDGRVRDLLLSKFRLLRDGPNAQRTKHARDVRMAELNSLRKGMDWEGIQERLGPAADAEGTQDGGFAVLYGREAPQEAIWLCFDVSQRFVKTRRTTDRCTPAPADGRP
jgi:hypothetical protein